jgi:ech hydrogenase subunit E
MLLALGPSHPLWPGPQQLLLRVEGERVVDVDYRADEEDDLARRLHGLRAPEALGAIARRLPREREAHALALQLALEQAAGIAAPPRAGYLRLAALETARARWLLDAAGQLFAIMGDARAAQALAALRPADDEAGPRIGGDIGDERRGQAVAELGRLAQELYRFVDRTIERRALLRRTVDVGPLSKDVAAQFGARGPLARASGIANDARADAPDALYGALGFQIITQEGGDVFARLVLWLLEALESLKLAERALAELPAGPLAAELPDDLSGAGEGSVEGPWGLLRYTVALAGGRLSEVRIDAPRPLDRLLARALLDRALVDNGLLIVASAAPAIGPRS